MFGGIRRSLNIYMYKSIWLISWFAQLKRKNQKPNIIGLEKLAELIARLVLDFEIDPNLNDVFTSKGRLYYAGIAAHHLTYDAYRKTWKDYEKLMEVALVNARWEIENGIGEYRSRLKEIA